MAHEARTGMQNGNDHDGWWFGRSLEDRVEGGDETVPLADSVRPPHS